MRSTHTLSHPMREHLRHVEALLEPIRRDGTITDADRRRQISDVLAAANARAWSLFTERRRTVQPLAASEVSVFQGRGWHRELARTG